MSPPFPPQFFILLGIDILLGGSVMTVLFDEHYPAGLPYILDFGALVGFIQLVLVPGYLTGYPPEVQFYYSMAYAVVAITAVLCSNLYVAIIRGKRAIGAVFSIAATLPSLLAAIYFASAFVSDESVTLPVLPLLPWPVVWGAFIGASALIMLAMVATTYGKTIRKPVRHLPEQ